MQPSMGKPKFLVKNMTAEQVQKKYGHRCADIAHSGKMQCTCCQAWMEFDLRNLMTTMDPESLYGKPVKYI